MTTVYILGGANCIWEDLKEANKLTKPDLIFAINNIGTIYHKIDHWVSFHPDKLMTWIDERDKNNLPPAKYHWTGITRRRLVYDKKLIQVKDWKRGSSGLLATMIALEYSEKIILIGIPMTKVPHYHQDHNGKKWGESSTYFKYWKDNKDTLTNRVKSMSGRTKQLLGAPSKEWCNGSMIVPEKVVPPTTGQI